MSRRFLAPLAAAVAVAGCSAAAPDGDSAASEAAAAVRSAAVVSEAATQPADVVDLTVYFREGTGAAAHLVPVTRQVPVGDDLARTALELLLAGPAPGDPDGLAAAVPTTTRVRDFRVDGDTAFVDLSAAVVADATSVGKRPEHELLALAAVANTLTEFPTIERVRMAVDGEIDGDFWGGWGLPRLLTRDTSVIATTTPPPPVPDLGRFSTATQRSGDRPRAVPVRVTSVRAEPHTGYVRVTAALERPAGGDLTAVPRAVAARRDGRIVLKLRDVAAADLSGPTSRRAEPGVEVSLDRAGRSRLRISVAASGRREFWLHTLSEPARVVLDVRI